MSATVSLEPFELQAVLATVGLAPGDPPRVAAGLQSLEARGLILGTNGGRRPSALLRAALAPVVLPDGYLALIAGDGSLQLQLALRDEVAVLAAESSAGLTCTCFERREAAAMVAAKLTTLPASDVPPAIAARVALLDEGPAAPIDAAGMLTVDATWGRQVALVCRQGNAITWLADGPSSRVARTEDAGELARLVLELMRGPA